MALRRAALLSSALALAAPCAHAGLGPGNHSFALQHGGLDRSYIAHVPPGLSSPAPLVVALHGGGGNAAGQQKYSRMDELADREGFVVLYPNGTGRLRDRLLTWNAGTCCGSAMRQQVDDVGFIAAAIDDLAARVALEPRRVYATGMSNGAMMAYRLGAELPERIAAIAPVAGSMVFRGAPRAPVPVLHIHSVDDPRALYAGGLGPPFPMTTTRVLHPAVAETLARWSAANGCKGDPVEQEVRSGDGPNAGQTATLLSYPGCRAPLEHWKLTGAGHVWPGGQQKFLAGLLGRGTSLVDANAEMWRFFSHARR